MKQLNEALACLNLVKHKPLLATPEVTEMCLAHAAEMLMELQNDVTPVDVNKEELEAAQSRLPAGHVGEIQTHRDQAESAMSFAFDLPENICKALEDVVNGFNINLNTVKEELKVEFDKQENK